MSLPGFAFADSRSLSNGPPVHRFAQDLESALWPGRE